MSHPPDLATALTETRSSPEAVLDHIAPADRTRRLIAIARPRFRDDLERDARAMGYL